MKSFTRNLCLIIILIFCVGCGEKNIKENKVEVTEKHLDYGLKHELERGMDNLKFSMILTDKFSQGTFDIMINNKNICVSSMSDFYGLNQMQLKDQASFIELQGKVGRYSSRMSESEFNWFENQMNEIERSLDRIKRKVEGVNTLNSMRTTLYNLYPPEKQLRMITITTKIMKAFTDSLLATFPKLSKAYSDSMVKKYSNEK